MTLEDVIERDLQHCRDAKRVQRERVREWNSYLETNRDSARQSIMEIFGGIVFLGALAGLCWLCCAMSGYHWE